MGWIFPVLVLISMIIGILPMISMTANNTMKHEAISARLIIMQNY
jgi:hypothetical protein